MLRILCNIQKALTPSMVGLFGSFGNLITSLVFKKRGLGCKLLQSVCCPNSKEVLYYENSTICTNKAFSLTICHLLFKTPKKFYSFTSGKKIKIEIGELI